MARIPVFVASLDAMLTAMGPYGVDLRSALTEVTSRDEERRAVCNAIVRRYQAWYQFPVMQTPTSRACRVIWREKELHFQTDRDVVYKGIDVTYPHGRYPGEILYVSVLGPELFLAQPGLRLVLRGRLLPRDGSIVDTTAFAEEQWVDMDVSAHNAFGLLNWTPETEDQLLTWSFSLLTPTERHDIVFRHPTFQRRKDLLWVALFDQPLAGYGNEDHSLDEDVRVALGDPRVSRLAPDPVTPYKVYSEYAGFISLFL